MKFSPSRFLVLLAVLAAGFLAFGLKFGAPAAAGAFLVLEIAVKAKSLGYKLGANVLTGLAADIYRAADIVGRELVGAIPSVTLNTDATKRAALNDYVTSHFTRTTSVGAITPAMTIPEGTDQTVDKKQLQVTNTASVKIPWTGEDIKHVDNGSGFTSIYGDQILQAMRSITNQIEAALLVAIKNGASRVTGTAGTTPFASNFNILNSVRKILVDNGCPFDGQITAVFDTVAGVNMRNLAQLQKVNESGDTSLLRQGTLVDISGMKLKESAGVASHTPGSGASYLLNGAGAVGQKALVIDTGSGTLLAGDVVTFAADTNNKYVLGQDGTTTLATLNEPGLRAVIADNNAMTVGAAYTGNVAFHKAAVELVVRPMAVPGGGDAAVDVMTIQDPRSGLVFEVRAYKGYMKAMFDVQCVYGYKVWKPEFIAGILG